MVGSWFGFMLLGRWMRPSAIPDSSLLERCMGCIVGSAACALKCDATKAQECGAKGIGARRNEQAQREWRTGPARRRAKRADPIPRASGRSAHPLVDGAEHRQ